MHQQPQFTITKIETPRFAGGILDAKWRFCSRSDRVVSETKREAAVSAHHSLAESRAPSGDLYLDFNKYGREGQGGQ